MVLTLSKTRDALRKNRRNHPRGGNERVRLACRDRDVGAATTTHRRRGSDLGRGGGKHDPRVRMHRGDSALAMDQKPIDRKKRFETKLT